MTSSRNVIIGVVALAVIVAAVAYVWGLPKFW